jgi:hypothetical protein
MYHHEEHSPRPPGKGNVRPGEKRRVLLHDDGCLVAVRPLKVVEHVVVPVHVVGVQRQVKFPVRDQTVLVAARVIIAQGKERENKVSGTFLTLQ